MFRIKICGVTSVMDAKAAAEAGADAIGLNFYPQSPRCIKLPTAEEICAMLPAGVCKIGLFVNAPINEVRERVAGLKLDAVQLHGDESPEYLRQLQNIPIIKVFRPRQTLAEAVGDFLVRCQQLESSPAMALIDAYHTRQMGGTGTQADWHAVVTGRKVLAELPLVLAGGLTPENVGEAIAVVTPQAVDTASGVESEPGIKDAARVRKFVSAAQTAFDKSGDSH